MKTPRVNYLNDFGHSESPLSTTKDFNGIDYLDKAAKNASSPHVIEKMPGPYKGITFSGIGDQLEIVPEELSWFENITNQTIPKIRIRIPELHCHLPEPDNYSSCKATIAHLYPEFIGESIDTDKLEPRMIAWCTYLDRNNFREPTLLKAYSKEQCVTDNNEQETSLVKTVLNSILQGKPASGDSPGGSILNSQFPTVPSRSERSDVFRALNEKYGANSNVVSDVEATNPKFKPLLEAFIRAIEEEQLPFVINETFRSQTRQASLYSRGRKQNVDGTWEVVGPTVTNTLDSNHKYGTAADFRLNTNPRHPYWVRIGYVPKNPYDTSRETMSAWNDFGNLAERSGLSWGGNWKSFKDLPHVEMRKGNIKPTTPSPDNSKEPLS